MEENEPGGDRSRPGRPHTVPPAPPSEAGSYGAPAGTEVMGEVDGALGLALWRALRDVHAWTETAPEGRVRYFAQESDRATHTAGSGPEPSGERTNAGWIAERTAYAIEQAPELAGALGLLALLPRAPELVDGRQLADACHSVYEWADLRGMVRTGRLFAEMAAHADPDDPARANFAARMCRRATLFRRSADWYQRGLGLAVTQANRKEAIYALLGCGTLHRDLGQYAEARRAFVRAARKASRKNHRREAAEARHDLLGLAAEMGTYDDAEDQAREAVNLYPRKHPRLPALANDYAYTLIRRGHYSPALALLEAAVHLIARPEERALVWSTLAWAAAGADRRDRYMAAEREILSLVAVHQDYAHVAFLHLAAGGQLLHEWDAAARYAVRAPRCAPAAGCAPGARSGRAELLARSAGAGLT